MPRNSDQVVDAHVQGEWGTVVTAHGAHQRAAPRAPDSGEEANTFRMIATRRPRPAVVTRDAPEFAAAVNGIARARAPQSPGQRLGGPAPCFAARGHGEQCPTSASRPVADRRRDTSRLRIPESARAREHHVRGQRREQLEAQPLHESRGRVRVGDPDHASPHRSRPPRRWCRAPRLTNTPPPRARSWTAVLSESAAR